MRHSISIMAMKPKKVDYHIHSSLSDGNLSPLEIAKLCNSLNIETFVITDHDSIGSYFKLKQINFLSSSEIISGVELDCIYENKEVHLLSYDFDVYNKELNNYLKSIQEQRLKRIKEQIIAINYYYGKIILKEEELLNQDKETYMKPLLIDKLIQYGIQSNLPYEAAYHNISEWLQKEIKTSTKIHKPRIEELIKLMKEAGGLCVLAHPAYYVAKGIILEEMIANLKKEGLDGIEVNYPYNYHSPDLFSPSQENEIILALENLAERFKLLKTAGSDSHSKEQIIFSNNHSNQ